jgi:hypothetical protein
MEIVEASEDELTARVPIGTPLGQHELSLSVGSQSAPQHPEVDVSLALGRVRDYPIVGGSVDIPLSAFNASTRYLAIAYDLRAVAPYDFDLISVDAAAPLPDPVVREFDPGDFHRRMLQVHGEGEPGEIIIVEGDRDTRDFNVFADYFGSTTDPASYAVVTATLRYQGDHIKLYVDSNDVERLPLQRCTELGQTFENQIYDTDRLAFGSESDFDGDGHVMVLLTRQVNLLTGQIDNLPGWSGEYIGGYFNPVDLPIWSWPAGTSNAGEIFYGIVPDPLGDFSRVEHTEDSTVEALKPILAHEFQHMINFYQRHEVLGGGSTQIPSEDLWINEGLSHLAEDLCGFDEHNAGRVKLYLHSGHHRYHALASLEGLPVGESVGNSLGERGASYLFLRYLADRWPGSPMDLVKSIVSGRDNVAHVTGETYEQVFKDWLSALVLDDSGLSEDSRYEYTSLNIRTDFPYPGGVEEPFAILSRDLVAPAWNSVIVPGSFDLLELRGPAPEGVLELRFTAEDASKMGILLIRTGL